MDYGYKGAALAGFGFGPGDLKCVKKSEEIIGCLRRVVVLEKIMPKKPFCCLFVYFRVFFKEALFISPRLRPPSRLSQRAPPLVHPNCLLLLVVASLQLA